MVPISARGLDAASRVLRLKETPSLKLKGTASKEASCPENVETVKPSCCCCCCGGGGGIGVVLLCCCCCCGVVIVVFLLCFV